MDAYLCLSSGLSSGGESQKRQHTFLEGLHCVLESRGTLNVVMATVKWWPYMCVCVCVWVWWRKKAKQFSLNQSLILKQHRGEENLAAAAQTCQATTTIIQLGFFFAYTWLIWWIRNFFLQQEGEAFSFLSIRAEERQAALPEEFTFHWETGSRQLPRGTGEMSSCLFFPPFFFHNSKHWRSPVFNKRQAVCFLPSENPFIAAGKCHLTGQSLAFLIKKSSFFLHLKKKTIWWAPAALHSSCTEDCHRSSLYADTHLAANVCFDSWRDFSTKKKKGIESV